MSARCVVMKKNNPQVQYWDSGLFISLLTNEEPERTKIIRELLSQAEMGNISIVISNLVLAEVRPAKTPTTEDEKIVDELLEGDRPYLRFYGLTPSIAKLSRKIGAGFSRITVPDAIHLATAITAKADVFFTYDGKKERKTNRSKGLLQYDGLEPYGLAIKEPCHDLGPLFENIQTKKAK